MRLRAAVAGGGVGDQAGARHGGHQVLPAEGLQRHAVQEAAAGELPVPWSRAICGGARANVRPGGVCRRLTPPPVPSHKCRG